MKLTHQYRFNVHTDKAFDDISDFDQLNQSIREHGLSKGAAGSDEYNFAVGAAYEVFCEYFHRRYDNHPHIGVTTLSDTSFDKYQDGYDFSYTSLHGTPGRIQTKWRSDNYHKFTRTELGTFCSILREEEIQPGDSILFTNTFHKPNEERGSTFHSSWDTGARKQMRVFDRIAQTQFILRDPTFWDDLRDTLNNSCIEEFLRPHPNRPHQTLMETNQLGVLTNGGRGTQICATGGGKSQCEFNTFEYVHFTQHKRLTILVAPTIDLVNQHFRNYYKYGFYHKGIHAINFCTGEVPDHDDQIDFLHGTKYGPVQEVFRELLQDNTKHVHVMTTYASVGNLVDIMEGLGIVADCIIFDEYQRLVSQKVNEYGISNMRQFLSTIPAFSTLFYSASIKRGRVVNALDASLFGEILSDVSYKYLREQGILVPRVNVVPIRISSTSNIPGLGRDIQEHAKAFDKIDIKEATIEAGGIIVAYEDAKRRYGNTNLLSFSKAVNHCKIIALSPSVKERLNETTLHVVHAQTKQRDRIYDHLRSTEDNILLQHSCVTEGVDVTSFNASVVLRSLGIIEMQQGPIGRVVRAHPEDTKRVQSGDISVDNPTGWIKYSSTIYVLVDDNTMDVFKDNIKDILEKLQFAGLVEDDYQMAELLEARQGVASTEDNWATNIVTNLNIETVSLEDVIRRAQLELEEEEYRSDVLEQVNKAKDVDELDELLAFC